MNDGLRWVVTQFHLDTRFVDAMPFSYMKPLSGSGSKAMMIYFFSSRRRHTIYWRDWSSDVCSSDLLFGERHLIAGAERNLLLRREPAGGHVHVIQAALLEFFCQDHRRLRRPAAVDPIGGGDAHADRLCLRPDGPHRLVHLDRKAHAIFERAAIFVGALIGER